MIDYIICDIDGTIADISHRLHFVTGKKRDYDQFYSRVELIKDSPISKVIETVTRLSSTGAQIVFVTGRPEHTKQSTTEWVYKHFPNSVFLRARFFFRNSGDRRKDAIVKEWIYRSKLVQLGISPENTIVFEDRSQCVDMWRSQGFMCFQPTKGDF